MRRLVGGEALNACEHEAWPPRDARPSAACPCCCSPSCACSLDLATSQGILIQVPKNPASTPIATSWNARPAVHRMLLVAHNFLLPQPKYVSAEAPSILNTQLRQHVAQAGTARRGPPRRRRARAEPTARIAGARAPASALLQLGGVTRRSIVVVKLPASVAQQLVGAARRRPARASATLRCHVHGDRSWGAHCCCEHAADSENKPPSWPCRGSKASSKGFEPRLTCKPRLDLVDRLRASASATMARHAGDQVVRERMPTSATSCAEATASLRRVQVGRSSRRARERGAVKSETERCEATPARPSALRHVALCLPYQRNTPRPCLPAGTATGRALGAPAPSARP